MPIVLFPACSILDTKATAANYAHPIIYLFLGGFMLAIAVEKTGLHTWIAQKMLGIFPNTARGIIISLAMTSGILSAILSNTTTTLLLISIALFLSRITSYNVCYTKLLRSRRGIPAHAARAAHSALFP